MKKLLIFIFVLLIIHSAAAAEFIDGRIRLVINEKNGRFSLYYMADIAKEEYLPFFEDKDPRTSFLALFVNNRSYRMGETSSFKTKLGGTPSNPALIFESSFLTVTQDFSFVKTGTSSLANGVLITITVTNRGEKPVEPGIRFLIDTNLGEKTQAHFFTNLREINNEAFINSSAADNYWVSKNSRVSLMGSIISQNTTRPDLIHFANWKRLNDVSWKIPAVTDRNFNLLPYSINDSAVCYYYDPAVITPGNSRIVSLILSSEDTAGFASNSSSNDLSKLIRDTARAESAISDNISDSILADLIILRDLSNRLDEYAASGTGITDEEFSAIGLLILRIKTKYGIL